MKSLLFMLLSEVFGFAVLAVTLVSFARRLCSLRLLLAVARPSPLLARFLRRPRSARPLGVACRAGCSAPAFRPRRFSMIFFEHRAGLAALRRTIRFPDVRLVGGEDVLEVAFALDALRRELGDVDFAGPVVAMLDQQPAAPVAASAPRAARPCARAPTSLSACSRRA